MTATDREPEDVGMAAEYALGVLDAGERRLAESRLASPVFAAEVRAWEDRLHPLTDAVQSEPAPEGLWPRIDASVSAVSPKAATAETSGWWRSLAFWRGSTAGMGALAAASVAVVMVQASRPDTPAPAPAVQQVQAQPPMVVARLAAENGPTVFIVAYDPMRRTTLITPLTPAQANRVHELWVIPADGTPRSLGVIGMDSPARYAVPEPLQALVGGDGTLAVSLEPMGGSPTGAPTGPVVASGPLSRV